MKYIGITPRISKNFISNNQYDFISINMTYCNFIHNLDYEYLIIPTTINDELLKLCDGFIIIGGEDINPKYYYEKNSGSNLENPIIDEIDFKIIDYAINNNKFILGICRGIQVINVYFGGTLIQDLGEENYFHHHKHKIKKISKMEIIQDFDDIEIVNSLHHQAIKNLGENLIALFKINNIIEMIIHNKYKIIGVQWHPERLSLQHQLKFKNIITKLGEKNESKIN